MRRSLRQAFGDLRRYVSDCAHGRSRPGISIFVYPPEWEGAMLAQFPSFVRECSDGGWALDLIDVSQGLLGEIERRKGLLDQLVALEQKDDGLLRHDLGVLAERYLRRALTAPLAAPSIARLVVNTGALATFVSYSAITNSLYGSGSQSEVPAPTVLAFPGEGDERSLNLLRLRTDTNYRVPRI